MGEVKRVRPQSCTCAAELREKKHRSRHVDTREAYLDYGAATPVAPEVLEAMLPYFSERFYNPSAPYSVARGARADLEAARATLAHLIGARPGQLTLTAGATEANNLAFAAATGPVLTDAAEHESVLACAKARPHVLVGVDASGRVDPQEVEAALTPQTELVSVELANGEVGTIQPIREIAQVVERERFRRLEAGEQTPLLLHTDASQAALTHATNVSSLGVDLMTLSAAKVYGPKQVGLLWAGEGVALHPLVRGGGQEGGVRSGTENVAGAVGFARALELATQARKQEASRLASLRNRLQRQLQQAVPTLVVSGPKRDKSRLPGLLHVSFPGLEAQRLVIALERRGVYVGTGSACAASRMQESHVLRAMGAPAEVARGSLRITLGRPTTQELVDYAAKQIVEVAREEAARVGVSL